jgi:hypothetical protein
VRVGRYVARLDCPAFTEEVEVTAHDRAPHRSNMR